MAKYYFTTFAFYALLRYFHHRPRSVRGGVNAASITTTAAATITSSSTAATVESQKKTRGGKGSKKIDVNDLTGDDESGVSSVRHRNQRAKAAEDKASEIEKKAVEALKKQLDDLLAENKENEKKRRREEAEIAANCKAMKKALDAAEKEKEKALEKAARMEEEKENTKKQLGPTIRPTANGAITGPNPLIDHQSGSQDQQKIPGYQRMGLQDQQRIEYPDSTNMDQGLLKGIPLLNFPADALMSFWDQQDLRTEMKGRLHFCMVIMSRL